MERYQVLSDSIELGYITTSHLQSHFPSITQALTVDARIIPNASFIQALMKLGQDEYLSYNDQTIAFSGKATTKKEYRGQPIVQLLNRWDLFKLNGRLIQDDFALLTKGKTSQALPDSCSLIGNPANLFY